MNIDIGKLALPQATSSTPAAAPLAPADKSKRSFAELLKDLTSEVDAYQKNAQDMVEGLATGEVENVHDVVMALDKAELSFRMMADVRNRLIEAYREVTRMGV
ncbi:MAG: flagellar hook-basal body complex protein FliE [Planctomycetota bacterium]